jgi:predicted AAA+ superfamily ATPase
MRYLADRLRADLKRKMVLLAGPRQCGKTTLAKSLLDSRGEYLNWDITKDRRIIRDLAWPKDASLVVLDELHKASKWKNLLKGVVDEFDNKPPLLVTGSARLDAFRRAGKPTESLQLVLNLRRAEEQSGIKVVSLAEWLETLWSASGSGD